jgi:hypothetical protein
MDDPPVEGYGHDIGEALSDLKYEVDKFGEGVHEAIESILDIELDL